MILAAGLTAWAGVSAAEPGASAPAAEAPPTRTEKAGGWLKGAADALRGGSGEGAGAASADALSPETIVAGLKGGLRSGVDAALAELGRPDGFMGNPALRVPLPAELAKGEQALRKLGQEKLADDLVLALNRAAEKAVAETGPIFKDAITGMSLEDARGILDGPSDAATGYFRRNTEGKLREKMMPIVAAATDASGAGAAYKRFAGKAAPLSGLLGGRSLDLDAHVCDRALDGLFKLIATREAELRANPAAATEELLRRVFGAAKGS